MFLIYEMYKIILLLWLRCVKYKVKMLNFCIKIKII
jgi:hypothetical protein